MAIKNIIGKENIENNEIWERTKENWREEIHRQFDIIREKGQKVEKKEEKNWNNTEKKEN